MCKYFSSTIVFNMLNNAGLCGNNVVHYMSAYGLSTKKETSMPTECSKWTERLMYVHYNLSRGHFRFLLFRSYTGHDWPVRIHNFWPMNLVVSTVSGSILCSEQSMTATLCHVHKCYISELLIHLPGLHWTWDQRKLQFQEKEELCNILILLKMTIAAPGKFLVLMRKFWEKKQIWWAIDLS